MKINRKQVVELLKSLDFPKAATWDDEKLKDYAVQVPSKVKKEDITPEFLEIYEQLEAREEHDALEFTEAEQVKDKTKPKNTKPKNTKPKNTKPKNTKPKAPKTSEAKVKNETKPAKSKPETKVKGKAKKESKKASNNGESSYASIINAVLKKSGEWMTLEEVVKASGLPEKNVRNRLYAATRRNYYTHKRTIAWKSNQ